MAKWPKFWSQNLVMVPLSMTSLVKFQRLSLYHFSLYHANLNLLFNLVTREKNTGKNTFYFFSIFTWDSFSRTNSHKVSSILWTIPNEKFIRLSMDWLTDGKKKFVSSAIQLKVNNSSYNASFYIIYFTNEFHLNLYFICSVNMIVNHIFSS